VSVKILADSACDLPLDYLEEHNISLVPLTIHIDEKDYEDLITIQPIEVYDAMRSGKIPKTSQVSPHHFKKIFTSLAENHVSCIYIALSTELSGTYQTAMIVGSQVQEEYPDFKLAIIDTKCASLGVGLVIVHAQQLADSGKSIEEIETAIRLYCTHMEHIFTVGNLDYLARGGRISKSSAFVGGLLNIKPILNMEDGKLVPLEKLRGKKKALKRMIDIMEERGENLQNQLVGISHADDKETALEMKELIIERFGTHSFFINTIGAAIGSHTGPGTLSIFFLNDTTV
jgi:DegV family protein with EDD domain